MKNQNSSSFIYGMAKSLDLGNTLKRKEDSLYIFSDNADFAALKSDWEAVGKDIAMAIGHVQTSK